MDRLNYRNETTKPQLSAFPNRREEISRNNQVSALDLTANETAKLTGLTHKTVNRIYLKIRQRLAKNRSDSHRFPGRSKPMKATSGPNRSMANGAAGWGQNDRLRHLQTKRKSVYRDRPACPEKDAPGHYARASQHRDRHPLRSLKRLNGLVDIGYPKHFRVNHSVNEFANEISNINGIESFWPFGKRRLLKFNGVKKGTFHLH